MHQSVPFRLVLMLCLPLAFAAGAASAQITGITGNEYDDPGEGPPARCPSGTVKIFTSGMSFSPATVTVEAGARVCWENSDEIPHSVKSNSGAFGMPAPSPNHWAYTVTLNDAGTFPYYCEVHGSPSAGMRGTVIVQGGGGGDPEDNPGTLRFAQTGPSVSEGTANASITVSRVNGDDGAVSATWTSSAGTATAGSDFTAGSGTLNWADGDDANKSFTVPIVNDSVVEGNETIQLALSSPTGGATLDAARKNATLTITDNDSSTGGTPAAPTNLKAAADPGSTTEIDLTWTDAATNETGFRIEQRTLNGTFQEVGTAPANSTSYPVQGLDPKTFYLFRVRASGSGGTFSGHSAVQGAATNTVPGPCAAGATTLCVNNDRFQVDVEWRTGTGHGNASAVDLASAPDSGLFYFFDASNIEMLIKTINACSLNNRYWVFFAATTNVELSVVVTDTQTGKTKAYFNPLGQAVPPVQDTSAFATCP